MLISIIIPIFNAKNYLVETISSVLNQTYQNLEIILVDDGSNDGSYELAEQQLNDQRIKLVKNPKKGACAARNYGFKLSTGSYIQFLDADDLLNERKIEEQVKLASMFGRDTLYSCSWAHFKSNIKEASIIRQIVDRNYNSPYLWLKDSWLGGGVGQTSIWLTHRKLIEKSGGWNEELKLNQDGEFFSRVILVSKSIIYSNKSLVYYRKGNMNSISQSNINFRDKASSLLESYISYKNSAISYGILEVLKEGIANNFLTFIDQYYHIFPKLAQKAEDEFYDLGYTKIWAVGGYNSKKLASLIGFKNMLRIRNFFKN